MIKKRFLKNILFDNFTRNLHPFCLIFVSPLFLYVYNLYLVNYILDAPGPAMASPTAVVPAVPVTNIQPESNIHFGNS